jgi:hypothetical protein
MFLFLPKLGFLGSQRSSDFRQCSVDDRRPRCGPLRDARTRRHPRPPAVGQPEEGAQDGAAELSGTQPGGCQDCQTKRSSCER